MAQNQSKPRTKPELSVVADPGAENTTGEHPVTPAELAHNSVEHALAQIGVESRPLLLRSDVRREQIAQDVREVEGLLGELRGREDLLDRVYQAAKLSVASHREDLEAELALLQRGLSASTAPASGGEA